MARGQTGAIAGPASGPRLDGRCPVTRVGPIGRLPSDEDLSQASVTGAQVFHRPRIWQPCPRQGSSALSPYPSSPPFLYRHASRSARSNSSPAGRVTAAVADLVDQLVARRSGARGGRFRGGLNRPGGACQVIGHGIAFPSLTVGGPAAAWLATDGSPHFSGCDARPARSASASFRRPCASAFRAQLAFCIVWRS